MIRFDQRSSPLSNAFFQTDMQKFKSRNKIKNIQMKNLLHPAFFCFAAFHRVASGFLLIQRTENKKQNAA
jgi:hypothetical protein